MAKIEAVHENPRFKVKDNEGESEYKTQDSGIRQGCALSPYLFLLVMTVMLADIYERQGRNIMMGRTDGWSFAQIFYADDTLLVLRRTQEANIVY